MLGQENSVAMNATNVDADGVKTLSNGVKVYPNGDQIIPVEVMEAQAYEQARENQLQTIMKEAARLMAKVQVLQMQVQGWQQENAALKQALGMGAAIPKTVVKSLLGEQKVAEKVAGNMTEEANRRIAEAAASATAKLNKKDVH